MAHFAPVSFFEKERKMLFYNAGIFTGREENIKNGYVLIKGSKIIDVGPMAFCPRDEESYDLSGMVIYPGFIDAH